jgi:two-component system, OmpR family, sensor kinase
MKLEHRLTLLTASVTASTVAACLFTAFWFVKRAAATDLDELVLDGANAIALVVAEHEGRLEPTESIELDVPEHAVRIVHHAAVFDRNGSRVAKTTQFEGVPDTLAEVARLGNMQRMGKTFDLRVAAGLMRAVVISPIRRPQFRVLHAVPREPTDTSIAAQRQAFFILFISSLALVVLGASWLGRRLAADVNHVTDVARRVGSGDLSARAGTSHLTSPETQRLAAELNNMIAELLTLISSQRNFISYAAHELRSPLTALQGELQLALRRPRSAESYVESLGSALTEVQALAQLAEDLLTLARAQAHPRSRAVSCIDEVVDEAMRLVQGSAQVKETEIVARVDEVRKLRVVGGKSDLARALRNLLENAIKFGPRSSQVELLGRKQDQTVVLTVQDQGPGVSERDLEAIFQPFFRGTSRTTSRAGGTGLGLAIAREIARNVGGEVEYVAVNQPGARFQLRLVIGTPDTATLLP